MRLLRLAPRSKVAAWNAIRAAARAPIIVFADADVRVARSRDPAAGRAARARARSSPSSRDARQPLRDFPSDGLVARVAALPHRFDFGNVPGRLYALRVAALPEPMPATVLHEDAYLTVRLGRRALREGARRGRLPAPADDLATIISASASATRSASCS